MQPFLEAGTHEAEETVMEAIEPGESRIDRTVSKLEAQLERWAAELDQLIVRAEIAGEQARIDSRMRLDELKAKLAVAREKLEEAKTAGDDKWDAFKQSVEASWKELERGFKNLAH
jgi:hypothetical protein